MTEAIDLLLVSGKLLVLVLGSVVAVLAYRAYVRTRIAGLQYFAAGLMVVTLGTFLVGILHHVVGLSLFVSVLFEIILICTGFLVMIYALYLA